LASPRIAVILATASALRLIPEDSLASVRAREA